MQGLIKLWCYVWEWLIRDLSSAPRAHLKDLGLVMYTCENAKVETGRRLSSVASQLSQTSKLMKR